MTESGDPTRAAEMRAEFDRAFALAAAAETAPPLDVLLVTIATQPFALRLAEVAALHADLTVVAMPTAEPSFLGLATVRNTLVPVYDLAAVLDTSSTATSAAPRRWYVSCRAVPEAPLLFALDGFDGHARVEADASSRVVVDPTTKISRPVVELFELARGVVHRFDATKDHG